MGTLNDCDSLYELSVRLDRLEDDWEGDEGAEPIFVDHLASLGIDVHKLPTFGGEAPEDRRGIWSWDAESVLINGDHHRFEIALRSDLAE